MSRSIVRGLTAAIVLVTVFCFAMPAVAAPRSHAARTPVVHNTGVFDQVLSWFDSLLLGNEQPKPQGPAAKSLLGLLGDILTNLQSLPTEPDRGGMIDPNGHS
jgi:hypothetical protein